MFENFSFSDFFSGFSFINLIRILVIGFLGIVFIRVIRWLLNKFFLKSLNQQSSMMISKIINWSGYFLLLLIILSELGIELTAILGTAGIMGLAVGVASQKSLGNIISGFFLIAEKSFEIGDIIRIGDKTGIVHSIDNLAVMLKTFDNQLVRLPNESIISSEITNITRFPIRRMDFNIKVDAGEDLETVFELLNRIACENKLCLDDPSPLVLVSGWDESGASILFGIWFEKENYLTVKNEISMELSRQFRNRDIHFSYPHRILVFPDDNAREGGEMIEKA